MDIEAIATALTEAKVAYERNSAGDWVLIEPTRVGRRRLVKARQVGGRVLVWCGQGDDLIREDVTPDEVPAAVVRVAMATLARREQEG